ncbi:MAG: hypothetical protein RLZZ11_1126 [Cyanobacteriota bacterium]|jgi:hypothetical protein
MTASCFSTPLHPALLIGASRPHPRRRVRKQVRPRQLALPALLALVLGAALLAPEQPRAQAEICQRHNGAAACRVW